MRILRGVAKSLLKPSWSVVEGPRLQARRRQQACDVMMTVRCPRCGGELVARMGRERPGFWCHCPVRRTLALGA